MEFSILSNWSSEDGLTSDALPLLSPAHSPRLGADRPTLSLRRFLLNSVAMGSGQYWSFLIASKTFVLVVNATLPFPFVTRETVVLETPASLATSLAVAIAYPLRDSQLLRGVLA